MLNNFGTLLKIYEMLMEVDMDAKLKRQWEKLHYFSRMISEMEPWERFSEDEPLAYIQKGTNKEIVFSMIGSRSPFCGFAVYDSWIEFCAAKYQMTKENKKDEPTFILQNAMIGIWGSRSEVSKANYAVLKELDLRGHGDGSWLHFEKYRIGYIPADLSEKEVSELADSMGNLHMLLKAIYEHGPDKLEPGTMPIRMYNKKTKLYENQIMPRPELVKPQAPNITVDKTEDFYLIDKMPRAQYTLLLDWSFIPMPIKEDGKAYVPRLLIGMDRDGIALFSKLILIDMNQVGAVLNTLADAFDEHGKPVEIKISDLELEGIIGDFCKKLGIKVSKVKNLPHISRFRKGFLEHFASEK